MSSGCESGALVEVRPPFFSSERSLSLEGGAISALSQDMAGLIA